MALNVTLYEFKKRENSTKRPDASVTQKTHEARLKAPTSLLHPVLTFDFTLKGNPSYYNYAYISDFGNRYYYIRDWTVEDGHIWRAQLDVDPLASWKNSIGESTQYVTRSSNSSDGNIIDSLYPAKGPATLLANTTDAWTTVTSISGGSYVVGIINNSEDAIGAVAYYVFTEVQFRTFMKYLMGDLSWTGDITDISADLLKVLFNPMQYVASVTWYPDAAPKGTSVTSIPFGWWNIPVKAAKLKTSGVVPSAVIIDVPKHPQATSRGNFLNSSPFAQYELDSRVWGNIPIDTTALLDVSAIWIEYTIDFTTGIADAYIKAGTTDYCIATRRGMYGVPIQIAQIGQNYVDMAITAVNSAASVAKNWYNPVGAITAGANAVGDMINASLPQFSTSGSNGTIANFTRAPTLYGRFLPIVNEDNEDRGRPYCKKVQLSTLPGYQVIADPDIALAGTAEENRAVKSFLSNGYFYE